MFSSVLLMIICQQAMKLVRQLRVCVCSIGILTRVLFVNVFTALQELWEGFERAKGLPWAAFHDCFKQLSSVGRVWEESIYILHVYVHILCVCMYNMCECMYIQYL